MNIELTRRQGNMIAEALDLYIRVHMGQLKSIFEEVDKHKMGHIHFSSELNEVIDLLTRFTFGHGTNTSMSIASEDVPHQARECYDMLCTIRKYLHDSQKPDQHGLKPSRHSTWANGNILKLGDEPVMKITDGSQD